MDLEKISEWFENLHHDFSDTRIPSALSNDENKLLEENIEVKIKELTTLQRDTDENIDRIQMIENHQKMIQDELDVIQRLLSACRTEETTGQSHFDIDRTEIKRIERLIIILDNDLNKSLKRKNDFQLEIDQLHIQIEKLHDKAQIEKDNLEKVIDIMNKRDEEAFCLMKYTREDDIRIKELTLELERYTQKSIQLKRTNEEKILEYQSYEIEVDKIAETFRRSYIQRQQLIQRWERILQQMQRKDYDIDRMAFEIVQIKSKARVKEQELNERKLFYEHEQKNNIIIEKLIDLTNQNIIKLKAKQKIYYQKQEDFQTDVSSLKTALINTQNQLQHERLFINDLNNNIIIRQQDLTKLKDRHQQMIDRKRFILNEKYSIDEKLLKFEKLMDNEQKYQNNLNKQYKKSTEQLISLNNELGSIRKHEKDYEMKNQLSRNQIHNLKNQINKFDQQLLKQQELIYHQDFQKQLIDRRFNKISNDRIEEKNSQSDNKIRQLETEHEQKKSQYNQLQNQIKIVNEELRIAIRDYEQLNDEKNNLNKKFLQFDLYTTLSEKIIKKLNNQKEDYLVETNFLNIELKRLKNILHNSSEINSNLEQQQIEIQKAIKERRMEVQANSQLFQIRLNDERTKKLAISNELATRINKIEKLKHRYETFSMTKDFDKCAEDSISVQAQNVIQFAQMKEDLLRQGDQLEGLIVKAETELRALENTVQILKWNNMDVKRNFDKLTELSPEMTQMKQLEEHLRAITDQVKIRRKLLKDFLENQPFISQTELIRFKEEIEQTNYMITEKRHLQTKLEDEIDQYFTKINRAEQLIKRLQQTMQDQPNFQDLLSDIDIRLQRETNQKLEQQLISLCFTLGDETLIDILEQISSDQNFNININSSSIQTKKHIRKSSSISNGSIISNTINISIDTHFK